VKTLSTDELKELPKLSETILKFGQSILREMPPNASVEDLRRAMVLIELAWNIGVVANPRPHAPSLAPAEVPAVASTDVRRGSSA
jgi:hypothetical protein